MWFTVKVKYTKQMEDGRLKRVTEPYLVDAVSFTEAEARIYNEVGQGVQGEMAITGISRTDFADIFYYEDSEDWYKCKLTYITMDEESGKEKKTANNFLVTAHSVKDAFERIKESLSDMTVTFEIPTISLTSIVEVLPYNPDLDVELDRRPLEESDFAEEEEVEEEKLLEEEEEVTFSDEMDEEE